MPQEISPPFLKQCTMMEGTEITLTPEELSANESSDSNDSQDLKGGQRSPSPWMVTAAQEEFLTPPKNRINTSTFGSVLIRFRSPAAHRLQLRSASCAIWFPENLCAGFAESFSFMTSQAPNTPSLAVALDASCLIQIGQERHDERMVLEGKKMYCDALRFLRIGLALSARQRSDALLGTIMVLQVSEANMVMDGADWRNHSKGVTAFMRDRIWSEKRSHFGWPRLVEHQFRTFQYWDALSARRPIDGVLLDDAPALLLIAQTIPGALAECDEVCYGCFDEEQAIGVARRLKDIETDLVDWTAQWNRCMREAPFQLVASDKMPFPKRNLSTGKQKDAFPHIFRFNELTDCLDHVICSASMLVIKRAMLDLSLAARTSSAATAVLRGCIPGQKLLTNGTTACADTLCMGLPYLCEPQHGKFGKLVTAPPLGIAREWYAHLMHDTGSKQAALKLAWCRNAAMTIENEGIRMLT